MSLKAFTYTKYGSPDVLQLVDVPRPIPKQDEVLVKICAASVNAADWHNLTADYFLVRLMAGGLLRPKKNWLGGDIAGIVEAVGPDAMSLKPGDEVYGDILGWSYGGFAEYAAVPGRLLAIKPANLSFDEAASIPIAGLTALQGLRDHGKIQAGQKVLINGASGGVGTFAVQIAKAFGAEVTAVCSTRNQEQARQLGADHVVDYTLEDFTCSDQKYDLILAANGYHSIAAYRRSLTPRGIYVMAGGKPAQLFQALLLGPAMSSRDGRQMLGMLAKTSQPDLVFLKDLAEAGKLKPVIEQTFSFLETPQALRYFGIGHARGKLVIRL